MGGEWIGVVGEYILQHATNFQVPTWLGVPLLQQEWGCVCALSTHIHVEGFFTGAQESWVSK